MKYYKSKTARFLNGKGFYLVLALCMVAIGFAAYSAFDAIRLDDTPAPEQQQTENEIKNEPVTQLPVTPEVPPQITEEVTPTETETQEKYYISAISGSISKPYSADTLQYSLTFGDMRIHLGTDITPIDSTEIKAAADGVVLSVDSDTTLGNVVSIDHGDGIVIRYCGVTDITVEANDHISLGDKIGGLGIVTSECAEEDHLHIEVLKDGEHINPADILPIE